jgi:heparosan-N-sulfate-glucuronate 5-epimerase
VPWLRREPQRIGTFTPGVPESGYYNDLSVEARKLGTAAEALEHLKRLTKVRELANPVTVAQIGLGSWSLAGLDARWSGVAEIAAEWLATHLDAAGRLAYFFPTRHTFVLEPPWYSAMAQGEAASLLVRAAGTRGDGAFVAAASAAVRPLLAQSSPLVVTTPDGPVLQEYPTSPPAHVLNGWIFALWGLYDVSAATRHHEASAAFEQGVDALASRLRLYRAWPGWSRYDLFPHPLPNVASPFYHRLHVAQLGAMHKLAPRAAFEGAVKRWAPAASSVARTSVGTLRKGAFRVVRPRSRLRAHRAPAAT